jgi:hypothetical protein
MREVQTSGVITVDLSVRSYRAFPEDGMVQVWGHVGDYDVCVHLPIDDARIQRLLARRSRASRSEPG